MTMNNAFMPALDTAGVNFGTTATTPNFTPYQVPQGVQAPTSPFQLNTIGTEAFANTAAPGTMGIPAAPQQAGLFGDFGAQDWMNFGLGIGQIGLGAYFQNRQLGLAEDQLALNQDQFNEQVQYRDDIQANTRRIQGNG